MWTRLSLQARLSLPMIAMVLASLVLGGIALEIVSPDQFEYENAQGAHSAKAVAAALNAALAASADPQATLAAFASELGKADSIAFRQPRPDPPRVRVTNSHAPRWFVALLDIPEIGAVYPVTIAGNHVGDIVFTPDLSADVFEKWIGFLAITLSGSGLMLMAALSAHFTSGSAIRPLGQLQEGLARLRAGDYDSAIPLNGPPEIRKSCEAANQLSLTLRQLSRDNRNLLRKLVSVQDDERRELARELHDELGPLLFAIRANATALSEAAPDHAELRAPAHGILQAAEQLLQANRRILEGLTPLYVQELGLAPSIDTLLQNARAQAPQLKLVAQDRSAPERHRRRAVADHLSRDPGKRDQRAAACARHQDRCGCGHQWMTRSCIEISDDGVGFSPQTQFGRGLTGMRERVRALDGILDLSRENGRTFVRCRLPLAHAGAEEARST